MPKSYQYSHGNAHPLGATCDEGGVKFSIYSENATSVVLLLFDTIDSKFPSQTITLDRNNNSTFNFWHVYIHGLKPGAVYAYRLDGPNQPDQGHRFNRNKVLIDPYAKEISNNLFNRSAACSPDDNISNSLRCVVQDPKKFDWGEDTPINRPMEETIIYELHTGAFTKSPTSDTKYPGTFSALQQKIPYLVNLGITAIQVMPIFEFDDSDPIRINADGKKLRDFWGYNPIGFFSPNAEYCIKGEPGRQHLELKRLIKALHQAGIEVILDVVFNHTGENNHSGPTISFKGIDNSIYYFLVPTNLAYYLDFSGCGNTLKCNHPIVQKLIIDCLEYWVKEYHIDGFRFDEASILSRGEDGSPLPFPPVIWQMELSETLANTKIIAEAWDAGGLNQVGYFPGFRTAELNGRYRDDLRSFVKGDGGNLKNIAQRIAGSADMYQYKGRLPINSVNFVTTHDGFTLNDLVSYNTKHNEQNGDNNTDGIDNNISWNCGIEGPSDNSEINVLRLKQIKNFATLLLLSRGVPLILYGDEVRRTQNGNNNVYCQDNELSWFNWDLVHQNHELLVFFQNLIEFRKSLKTLTNRFFFNDTVNKRGLKNIDFHGTVLNKPGWDDAEGRALSFSLAGHNEEPDLFVAANMSMQQLEFEIPSIKGRKWRQKLNTALASPEDFAEPTNECIIKSSKIYVEAHSVIVLVSS